jgi:S-adenosyl-methyltransferase mraW
MDFHHVSVLLNETLDGLAIRPEGTYVDCTLGGGGHSHAIGERLSTEGMIVGLDQDVAALEAASKRLEDLSCQVKVIKTNFSNLKQALQEAGIHEVDGFVFDLGVSSHQLDTAERGFSYMQEGPLDMRMNQSGALTAETIVNTYSSEELYRIIWDYGEERWAKRIVRFILEAREEEPITSTSQLVDIIKRAIPAKARQDGPHPAKRTFQALRIEVNQELQILHDAFVDAVSMLKPKGRIAVITFHSLEDRITKQTFKELAQGCTCPPSLPMCVCHNVPTVKAKNKAIEPSQREVEENPRARSAKLRVAVKI